MAKLVQQCCELVRVKHSKKARVMWEKNSLALSSALSYFLLMPATLYSSTLSLPKRSVRISEKGGKAKKGGGAGSPLPEERLTLSSLLTSK